MTASSPIPQAPAGYDSVNEQQARQAIEERLKRLEFLLLGSDAAGGGAASGDNTDITHVHLDNDGLNVKDTDASHELTIKPGSDLTANRILTLTTGDAARTITLSGNPTLSDWFDQSVKAAASPTFASPVVTTLELGHASDTTLSRPSAGNVAVEGNVLYRAGGTDVPVDDGGSGRSSATAYAVICGGTTGTGAHQSIASVGTSGQVLTSNGAAALPTFQNAVISVIASGALSSAANLDIALDGAAYDLVEIYCTGWQAQTGAVTLQALLSQSGSFLTGASDYTWAHHFGAGGLANDNADAQIVLVEDYEDSGEGRHGSFRLVIPKPNATSVTKSLIWSGLYPDESGNIYANFYGAGSLLANTNAVEDLRLQFSSGNIQAGYYMALGYKFA